MEDPAWMVCEDIIARARTELMQEAMDLLHNEMDSGRIKIDGKLVTASEGTTDAERDVFVMTQLLADEQTLRSRYENFLRAVESGNEKNPEAMARLDEVRKFLLVVSQIALTVQYAKIFAGWFEEAGKQVKTQDPVEILRSTALSSRERREALEFISSSKEFSKSNALTKEELELVKKAYSRLADAAVQD